MDRLVNPLYQEDALSSPTKPSTSLRRPTPPLPKGNADIHRIEFLMKPGNFIRPNPLVRLPVPPSVQQTLLTVQLKEPASATSLAHSGLDPHRTGSDGDEQEQ